MSSLLREFLPFLTVIAALAAIVRQFIAITEKSYEFHKKQLAWLAKELSDTGEEMVHLRKSIEKLQQEVAQLYKKRKKGEMIYAQGRTC